MTIQAWGHECITEQAELSWGSVQAETVRLQRQIVPRLMDNPLKFTVRSKKVKVRKNVGSKKFLVKKFGVKIFWVQQILNSKKVCSKKF